MQTKGLILIQLLFGHPLTDFTRDSTLRRANFSREYSLKKKFPIFGITYDFLCAVRRHGLSVGANPTRQLSFQPVAIGAAVEATKRLEPSV
jgi:hypothetical protein